MPPITVLKQILKGLKHKPPCNNTLSRNPRELSEFVNELILDLRDVLI